MRWRPSAKIQNTVSVVKPMLPKSNVTVSAAKPSEAIFTIHGFARGTPLVYQGTAQLISVAMLNVETKTKAGPKQQTRQGS
jgi:hypothetical protein